MYEVECPCGAVFHADDDDVAVWRCPECEQIVEGIGGDDEADASAALEDDAAALEDPPTILAALPGVFVQPLRGHGPYVLAGGSLLLFVPVGLVAVSLWLGAYLGGFLWIGGLPVVVLIAGFLHQYLACVVEDASAGRREPTEWPLLDGFWSLLGNAAAAGVIVLAAFVPITAPLVAVAVADPFLARSWQFGTLLAAAGAAGALLLPIVFLAATLRGLPYAFAYASHVRAIRAAPSSYGLAALLCALLLGLLAGSFALFRLHYLLGALVPVLAMYLLTVLARAIGVYYCAAQRCLGWFGKGSGRQGWAEPRR